MYALCGRDQVGDGEWIVDRDTLLALPLYNKDALLTVVALDWNMLHSRHLAQVTEETDISIMNRLQQLEASPSPVAMSFDDHLKSTKTSLRRKFTSGFGRPRAWSIR